MRLARRLIGAIAGLIAVAFAATVIGAIVAGPKADLPQGDDVEIALLAGPIHYDILLPRTPQVLQRFDFAAQSGVPLYHPQVAWVVVGWGSRAFYTATGGYEDLRLGTVWTAITGDTAVMRVDVAVPLPSETEVLWLKLSQAQFDALLDNMMGDFTDAAPEAIDHAGLTATDRFFAAKGGFSIMRTCNVWVSDILRRAGVQMGAWTPAPYAVTLSHWWFHRV